MTHATGGSRAWSWRHAFASSSLPASTKAVLHTLGMFMNELGEGCYPSIADIVRYSGLDKKTVMKHLAIAREAGWIAVSQHGYRGQKWKRQEYAARWPERDLVAACPPDGDDDHGLEGSGKGGGAIPPRSGAAKVVESVPEGGGIEGSKVVEPVHQDKTSPENFPINSPVERERASADEQAREGKGKAGKELWQTADFQKRINRFVNGDGYAAGEWKRWTSATLGHIAKMAALLDEAELAEAERYRDAFLAKCEQQGVKVPMPVANYFRDRAWKALSQAEMARAVAAQGRAKDGEDATPTRPDGWAISLGPVWSACLHDYLIGGPEKPELAPVEGGAWLTPRLAVAWPKVHGLLQMASLRRGAVFAERWHAMRGAMEFVPLDSAVFAAWAAEYRRRGWPMMPVPEDGRGAYFPKGGPEGLNEFETMLASAKQEQVA